MEGPDTAYKDAKDYSTEECGEVDESVEHGEARDAQIGCLMFRLVFFLFVSSLFAPHRLSRDTLNFLLVCALQMAGANRCSESNVICDNCLPLEDPEDVVD